MVKGKEEKTPNYYMGPNFKVPCVPIKEKKAKKKQMEVLWARRGDQ